MFELPNYAQAYLESVGLGPQLFPHSPVNLYADNMSPIEQQAPQMPASAPTFMENPAVSNFISKEQEQAAAKNQAAPIAKGVEMARSNPLIDRIAATDAQKDAAYSSALGTFSHGMATMQSPNESTLYRIAANLNPAVAAYNQQVAAAEQKNLDMYKYEQEQRQKAEEAALEREYKIGMLKVHQDDLAIKKAKGPGGGLTDYQYQNLRNGYVDRAANIDEKELAAIDRATKNLRPTNESHKKVIEQKTAEIRKTYAKKRERLAKEALNFGIDLYGEFEEEPEEEAQNAEEIAGGGESIAVSGRQGENVIVNVNGKDVVVNKANFDAQPDAIKAAVLNYKG